MPGTGRPAARTVGSVERAMALLDALAESPSPLGTNELARRVGTNASSVSRLLGTLAAGLGHDMGNLLLPMDVRLGLLIEADLPRELHEHVVGIQKCARYLQRLSNGLRLLATDPAHVESRGATELVRWWNDVRIIMKGVLPGGVRFEDLVPEQEYWVGFGRAGLTQAVFNLVQNAADAIKEFHNPPAGRRSSYDVVVSGGPGQDPWAWQRAGATWWITGFGPNPQSALVQSVIDAGPKRQTHAPTR